MNHLTRATLAKRCAAAGAKVDDRMVRVWLHELAMLAAGIVIAILIAPGMHEATSRVRQFPLLKQPDELINGEARLADN